MGVLVRILVFSLLVGLALSYFAIEPLDLLNHTRETIVAVAQMAVGVVEWAVPYILLGAVVVVPISLVVLGLRMMRRR